MESVNLITRCYTQHKAENAPYVVLLQGGRSAWRSTMIIKQELLADFCAAHAIKTLSVGRVTIRSSSAEL